ncbi:hypothetical protein FBUS_03922 [Fasciolopsis buskii]|uniref:Uncharacterized protein n=1 Tax=Fasciolopsis buskii TaxID=27845 RepID=A0A8E0VP10_9TREM|nr:hypothetical protein FBUS_03922 [Fasciolopsis buski]
MIQLPLTDSVPRRASRTVSVVGWEASNALPTQPRPAEFTSQSEPTSKKEFKVEEAREIVKQILAEHLGSDLREAHLRRRPSNLCNLSPPENTTPMVCWLANIVRKRLVSEVSGIDVRHGGRHKVVVHILHVDQPPEVPPAELLVCSCGLWDSNTDRWFSVKHQTETGTILVTVFACYHE